MVSAFAQPIWDIEIISKITGMVETAGGDYCVRAYSL